jgi:hypothetical protein
MPVLATNSKTALLWSAGVAAILLVPCSTCSGQNPAPSPKTLHVEELKYKGTRAVIVGDEIEVIDPLVYWEGTPRASFAIFADPECRQTIDTGVCQVQGRPPDQSVSARFSLPKDGRFYVVRIIEGRGVDNRTHRYGAYWVVEARWPILVPKIDTSYSYGQYAYFNFAAGHSNYDLYSYEVNVDSTPLFWGKGSVVPIDSVWRLGLDKLDRRITLRGLYNGNVFHFMNQNSGALESSLWHFIVRKPSAVETITLWQKTKKFYNLKERGVTDSLARIDVNMNGTFLQPCTFRFIRISPSTGGYVLTAPLVGKGSITSSIPDLFVSESWKEEGYWQVLRLTPNDDLLRRHTVYDPLEVEITISFTDQFGSYSESFAAQLYSSR